ncbi:LamG domain-containing protein [Mesorhizobium mediterraneum]|uniref:LamG domain-containing protein n=1 Tax=Mesorhizobium mediterraneum TaxID=43617 RepID=UPI0017802E10|nr:LamG domain-containing protein [Mesorhizobium mediterraneum]
MSMMVQSGRFGGGGGGGPTDPNFASVVLLSGFEGADASTVMDDESNSNHTLTAVGNAQIDTSQFKFGASSLLLDGSGDRVTAPSHANFQFGSGQFTIEAFVRFNTLTADNRGICGGSTGANPVWTLTAGATGAVVFAYSTDSFSYDVVVASASGVVTTGTWYHLAADRDATGKIRIYVDGVMVANATPANPAITPIATPLTIGAQTNNGVVDMDGWIDEFRITKGVARYASDGGFTVPTAAFPRS